MDFRLSCGHTARMKPWENFFSVMRRHPIRPEGGHECMRCHLERKARKAEAFFGDDDARVWEDVPAVKP